MGLKIFILPFIFLQIQGQELIEYQQESITVPRLGSYKINRNFITLSGFSSGGSFAQQFFFSHSSLIHGIAVFSHTYYRCGPITGRQEDYDNACTRFGTNLTTPQEYNVNNVFTDIQNYSSRGLIDNTQNLYNKPLYIYGGSRNWLFTPEMSLRARQVFEPYIVNPSSIRAIIQEANLTLPTNRPEYPACEAPPNQLSLSNCGFSGALDSLQFLLGPNAVRAPSTPLNLEPLLTFDQAEFFYGIDGSNPNRRHDMDSIGFLYVPRICQNNQIECHLHFYFHGCNVGREFVGGEHVRNSGFLEVAEENGIIMVFPQVLSSQENDIGCWDTYGFTGPLYATKAGAQVTVVRNMLSRFLQQDQVLQESPSSNLQQPIVNSQPLQGELPVGQRLQRQQEFPPQSLPPLPDFSSRFFRENSDVFRFLESFGAEKV